MHALVSDLPGLVATYGCWFVGLIIALESMGLPLPGETTLVLAAIYAGTTGNLEINLVVSAATVGAILGDNAGYWLGHHLGFPLMVKYGRYIHLTEVRIKLGQYLFMCHGGKVVFYGRFVTLLRILAAFLAGTNRMSFYKFLFFNATGAIVWASIFGFGGYFIGDRVHQLFGPIGIVTLLAVLCAAIFGGAFVRRHEVRLQSEAERALPGPLESPVSRLPEK